MCFLKGDMSVHSTIFRSAPIFRIDCTFFYSISNISPILNIVSRCDVKVHIALKKYMAVGHLY